jgi:hypothetical protein
MASQYPAKLALRQLKRMKPGVEVSLTKSTRSACCRPLERRLPPLRPYDSSVGRRLDCAVDRDFALIRLDMSRILASPQVTDQAVLTFVVSAAAAQLISPRQQAVPSRWPASPSRQSAAGLVLVRP